MEGVDEGGLSHRTYLSIYPTINDYIYIYIYPDHTSRGRERERNFKGTGPLMGGATDHRLTTQVPSGEPFDLHT